MTSARRSGFAPARTGSVCDGAVGGVSLIRPMMPYCRRNAAIECEGQVVDWAAKLKREFLRPFRQAVPPQPPLDFSPFQKALLKKVRPYTMTSDARVAVLESAVRHTARHCAGAFVECGVAKGGLMMAIAYTLLELGI